MLRCVLGQGKHSIDKHWWHLEIFFYLELIENTSAFKSNMKWWILFFAVDLWCRPKSKWCSCMRISQCLSCWYLKHQGVNLNSFKSKRGAVIKHITPWLVYHDTVTCTQWPTTKSVVSKLRRFLFTFNDSRVGYFTSKQNCNWPSI